MASVNRAAVFSHRELVETSGAITSPSEFLKKTFLDSMKETLRVITELNDPESSLTIFGKVFTKDQKNGAAAQAAISLLFSQQESQTATALQIFQTEQNFIQQLTRATG